MDKEKYFKISRELGFPNRCPILNYCCRRAWTIGYLSGYANNSELKKDGVIPNDFEEKCIVIQGEAPGGSIGKGHGYFHNLCPEVSLFDAMNSLGDFKGTACTSGSYDGEEKPGFKISEEKHFSECTEEYVQLSVSNNQF